MKAFFVLIALLSTMASAQARDALLAEGAEKLAQLHLQADALAREEPRGAARLLLQGLELELPEGPEARALRADVHARRSELLVGFSPEEALRAAEDGLRELDGHPESPALALLELRRGEALEALGRDAQALESHTRVIAIARRLMRAKSAKETP